MASIRPPALGAKGCVERLRPTGETTHYILCVAPLLHPLLSLTHWIFRSLMLPYKSSRIVQNVFLCIASLRGPPIDGQDNDGVSLLCSAPYTLLPLRGIFPQGETRNLRRKTESHILHVPLRHSPFGGWRHHLPAPLGSVSLDSQSPTAPCESSSLATT